MDHAKKALSRVYWQYRNSPKLIAWLRTLPDIAQADIEIPLSIIADILDIDNQVAEQLDIAGRIVGIDRPRIQDPSAPLPDPFFRVMIRAKIMRNNSSALIDDMKRAVDFIFDTDSSVSDNQDMTMTLYVTRSVDPALIRLVDDAGLIPKPQGVRYRLVVHADPGETFGFASSPEPRGFADKFDPAYKGGHFAEKVLT